MPLNRLGFQKISPLFFTRVEALHPNPLFLYRNVHTQGSPAHLTCETMAIALLELHQAKKCARQLGFDKQNVANAFPRHQAGKFKVQTCNWDHRTHFKAIISYRSLVI